MDDDFEALLRQHVKARKVGSFPKQPPFYGPLRAIVKAPPPTQAEAAAGPGIDAEAPPGSAGAEFQRGGGFARKRPAPDSAMGHSYGGLSLLDRVGMLEREISELRNIVQTQSLRIGSLERLVGAPPPPPDHDESMNLVSDPHPVGVAVEPEGEVEVSDMS